MKKMIKLFVAFVIVMNAAVLANANDLGKEGVVLKVIQRNNDIYNIIYQSKEQQQVSIQFLDKDNKVLYTELIADSKKFVKSLDLSDLPAGTYFVQLISSTDTLSEEIKLLTAAQQYGDHVAVRAIGEEQFLLAIDEETEKTFDLYIKDAKGEFLHQGKVNSTDKKVYDLKNLAGSEATFLIYDGQEIVKEQQVQI